MTNLAGQDATTLRGLFVGGQASALEILEAHLDRIERTDSSLGAFIRVLPDDARRQARQLDEARSRGEEAGPLAAVPVGIKDIITVRGAPTTCGSRSLETYHSPFDATCVEKLKRAGGVIVGKLNMDEFAMGSSTEHSAFLTTRNPWDRERVAGGSSGGPAAAVASGQVPLAIGTDTGGSIRQPAAFTGTVGLKPTYGRVSRYGLVAFASSLDQAGPLSRTVRDAALCLSVMAGPDRQDMTCAEEPLDDYIRAAAGSTLEGLRVGVPAEFFGEGLDDEVSDLVGRCRDLLAGQGAELVEVSLPTMRYTIAAYYIVATAEASSNLARFDGVRYGLRDPRARTLSEMYEATRQAGFGPEVKRRIMLGTYALSAGYYDAYYLRAMKVRTRIRNDFDEAFGKADVLLGPTTPTPAFRLGEKVDDPLAMYLTDLYTVTANLSGIPALSLPCGRTKAGLPVGCQLMAKHFDEATLLRTASVLESALDLDKGLPDVAA